MSSPSKRMKLSTVSMVWPPRRIHTSTPQPSTSYHQEMTSPVSSILSENSRFQFDEDEEVDKENEPSLRIRRSLFQNKPISNSPLYEEEKSFSHDDPKTVPKFKRVGLVWQLHRPLNEDSLYGQIIENPSNLQEIADQLIKLYKTRPKAALLQIIQFCVDICGFQDFKVSDHYNFSEDSAEAVLGELETDEVLNRQTTLHNTARYLLMENRGEVAAALKFIVYDFIKNIIYSAHKAGVLYEEFFTTNLITFIKCLTFSTTRPIRHTAVIFALKILTGLVNCYAKFINENEMSSRQTISDDNTFQQQKITFERLFECLYFIFMKNCRFSDPKLLLMRVECAKESFIWIRHFPKLFIHDFDIIQYLLKLMIDASKEIRYAILCGCEGMLNDPNTVEFLKSHLATLRDAIGQRFYDVDIPLSVKAIDIFSIFYKINMYLITTDRLKILSSLVFDRYFRIGEAACRFLNSFMHAGQGVPEDVLKNLAKLTRLPAHYQIELLVEGSLYVFPEMQDWKLFIKVLMEQEFEHEVLVPIAGMFHQAIHQTLKGQSTVLREDSRKVVDIDQSEDLEVAKLLPELNEILNKYDEFPEILIEILKIFPCIRNDVISGILSKDYMELCAIIVSLFHDNVDKNLLTTLIEVLNHLQTIPTIAERVQRFSNHLCEEYSKELLKCLEQPSLENVMVALKVSILYQHFNLNCQFKWENLFDNWGVVHENMTDNLILCCKWYIIWSVRNLTDPTVKRPHSDLSQYCMLVLRYCNEFTSTCFNMLHNLNGQALQLKVYQYLCDFYYMISKELEAPIKINKQFESLKLTIEDKQLQNLLVLFLDKYIINNKTMLFEDRHNDIIRYIDLVHNNILPIEGLNCIFKYYHLYNDVYGELIEQSLDDIAKADDPNAILLKIMDVLANVYEDILKKYGSIDIRTQEARKLKLLAKQFRAYKHFSTKKDFHNFLLFSIFYSFKEDSNYSFLYFITPFLDLVVDESHRRRVYNFFMERFENLEKRPDIILYFANLIKKFKTPTSAEKEVIEVTPKKTGARPKKGKAVQKADKKESKKKSNKENTKTVSVSKTAKKGKKGKTTDLNHNSDVDVSLGSLQID